MSWRSARMHHGLDPAGRAIEGPHERWSRYAWHLANTGLGLLAALIFIAVATAVLDAAIGYRLPYVTGFLQLAAALTFATLAAVPITMRVGDALDRREAYRDDALQARLPLDDHLRRPADDLPDDPPDGRAPDNPQTG